MSKTNRRILTSEDWPHPDPPPGYVRVDDGAGSHYFIRESALDTTQRKRKDKPVGEKKRNKALLDLITGRKK